MKIIGIIAAILVIVGAINWGLVGIFDLDLVSSIFGDMSMLSRIVYVLVGLGGIYAIYMTLANKKMA